MAWPSGARTLNIRTPHRRGDWTLASSTRRVRPPLWEQEVRVSDDAADSFQHVLLTYRDIAAYQDAVSRFIGEGLTRGEPTLVAVPGATRITDAPGGGDGLVTMADMSELGRNPARVIPALRSFAEAYRARRIRIMTEFIWPGRSVEETCEAARHEALVEAALAGVTGTVVCLYDAARLPGAVLDDGACTHRWQAGAGAAVRPSPAYAGPGRIPAGCALPLPSPPPDAEIVDYSSDLRSVRTMVKMVGRRAGLDPGRVTDLILAVSELAANTLRHTGKAGIAWAWQTTREVICQVSDTGFIADPLAGLSKRSIDEPSGKGLWLVHQICDLVEMRTAESGTVVRLHVRLP
jgi:anti-sigma regulatory factor (Ser/Thr protein kinase)